ncbi:MAG: PBSX family phage terminase large subunit, partial [Coriobacteriia bacterium]|nr:PBSX family phage terminase large subunit [Coriobacteriia bacterium]
EFNARAKHNEVYCDSAEPKSIASWQALGINALPVKKWKGSVDAGIKWLQTRAKIVIDPKRAPLSAQEFSAYEYADDGNGGLKTYPDKDNHSIDKARYALSGVITSKKET